MCKIEFRVDNAAFREMDEQGNDAGICAMEVADTVSRIAQKIGAGYTAGPILDSNGNTVGKWSVGDMD